MKKNPPVFPPPFLFCSSSDNCLQQKMSCRHLAPRGREARYSPPNRHTCIHTRTHTPNVVVCVPVREWNMELHVHTQLLCMALYGCAGALHDVFVLHYYCVPVSWCCLSISPWSQSALAGFIEATDSVGTHTHTLAQARSSPDPRLIETDRDLVKLREQPGVVCRPGGIRPRVTEIVE